MSTYVDIVKICKSLTSDRTMLLISISQHRYSGSFCSGSEGLLQDLMNKATIRGNLSTFSPDIAATRQRGLDYVLGETNSYACHVRTSCPLKASR